MVYNERRRGETRVRVVGRNNITFSHRCSSLAACIDIACRTLDASRTGVLSVLWVMNTTYLNLAVDLASVRDKCSGRSWLYMYWVLYEFAHRARRKTQ